MSTVVNLEKGLREALEKKMKRGLTQSVELVINLKDVDVSKPEKRFSEVVELPHGLGSASKRIAVVATGELAFRASRSPNVDRVFERQEIEALIGNKKAAKKLVREFDFFLIEPQLVPVAARALGAALGGVGKAPTPIPANVDIDEFAARHRRSVLVRTRKVPQVMCIVGTEEMAAEKILDNARTVIERVVARLENGWANIKSIVLKLSMSPPVKLRPERKK
ncbi:MAG: 50S ribosomal protein L1 [Nitrososphaerota archaeon]|nr:50S ribosomal protein L1 [Candidatus Calditenuaceae archaeon]MDW8072923.1 50S ribosomal protein L1 [Nitrososphaerota archaeon]